MIGNNQHVRWSNAEKQVVIDNQLLSNEDLSTLLNRPIGSVKNKRRELDAESLFECIKCKTLFHRYSLGKHCAKCTPTTQEYTKTYRNSVKGKWVECKSNARVRGIEFTLTEDDLKELNDKPCNYCGGEVSTVGVDRIDSSKGYIKENVVSCCSRCNEMKMAHTTEDWFSQMKQILKHQGEIK